MNWIRICRHLNRIGGVQVLAGPFLEEEPTKSEEESIEELNLHKVDLIIFDKDGTLICFHSMWTPWALQTAQRIETASGLKSVDIANEVYKLLGFCPKTNRVLPGLLAEATMPTIKGKLIQMLVIHGMEIHDAEEVVNSCWQDCDTTSTETVKQLHNLQHLFQSLRDHNVKVAVCTADSREGTLGALRQLRLLHLVDFVVCGDDVGMKPKPNPHNALAICKALGVDPKETMIVGDTLADVIMGRLAKLGASVGVLSGISDKQHLQPHSDHIIPHVGHLLSLVLKGRKKKKDTEDDNKSGKDDVINSGTFDQKRSIFTWTSKQRNSSNCHTKVTKRSFSSASLPSFTKPTHIIIGAGSAGCVLANRLSEIKENNVLLLEAGPPDHWWNWKIHMPAALMYNLCDNKYNWFYHTIPQKHMDSRVMYWPRGRVWGGSSSLNAMVYVRGHPYDYDRWETEQGALNWSYANCLPYFKKAQSHQDGENLYRGGSGPLYVSRGHSINPLYKAWLEAGVQAGYGSTEDMNGYKQEGMGLMDLTIHNGRRWSASQAYLRPALKRPNLFTETGVFAQKLLFDGRKAVGVSVADEQGSNQRSIFTESEIILSGGAINSPLLLMLSGVGDADHLKNLDIPIAAHLPGVGANLQDHLEIYVQQACTQPITLYSQSSWKFPHNMIRVGLQWLLSRTGAGATSHLEAGGFVRSQNDILHPDIQFHFLPGTVHDHGRVAGDCHAYQVHVGPMRATSKGSIKLKSKDPREHPLIDANYLATESDRSEFRACIRIARQIFAQPSFDKFRGIELAPGASVQSDEQIDAFVRARADSAYHPSCTCKMGRSTDPLAVVDPQSMNVWNIDGLRVVDASVMPSIVSGNLNAPVIMLAERAADIIKGVPLMPALPVPVWKVGDLNIIN